MSEWQYYLIEPDQDPVVPDPSVSDGFVGSAGGGVFVTAATDSGHSGTYRLRISGRIATWRTVAEMRRIPPPKNTCFSCGQRSVSRRRAASLTNIGFEMFRSAAEGYRAATTSQ